MERKVNSAEEQLAGSPYLIEQDSASEQRFLEVQRKSALTRSAAQAANALLRKRAASILRPYSQAVRADIVTESNRIEGYFWDPEEVRRAIVDNEGQIEGPEFAIAELSRTDKKLYQVLGLYKAHEIADSWRSADFSPRASHIREFHRLILGDTSDAGRYKLYTNYIAGREDHKTADPIDVPREMNKLADWWAQSRGDSLLTATVVHAWLAHMHPFSDGNGRLARVLANLELSRREYAPLIVTAEADRGEYYAALEESDGGNILPLYELFERVVRRQAEIMSEKSYVEDLLSNRLLRG